MKINELFEGKQKLTEAKIISESIKMCKAMIRLMEDAGDFEWEPQPEFRGVQGVTTASGFGEKSAKMAQQKKAGEQVNASWRKLLARAKSMSAEGRKQMMPHLKQMVAKAQELGYTLDPDPRAVLGMPQSGVAGA